MVLQLNDPGWKKHSRPAVDFTAGREIPLLPKRLQVENQRQHIPQNSVRPVRIVAILVSVVIAVFISAAESLTKIISIVFRLDIVTAVAVGRILKSVAALIVGVPAIFAISDSSAEAFLVTIIHRLP